MIQRETSPSDRVDRSFSQRLLESAEGFGPDLVEVRRAVHRRPELGFEEEETARLVTDRIERWAPAASVRRIANTGVMATLGEGSPTVVLRACLDALPVEEAGAGRGSSYASDVPGVSHACGHDGQVAVLLGAFRLLAQAPPSVRVLALFQPAEEIDTGAREVLADGLLDGLESEPVIAFGFHGHPGLDAGTVGVQPGPVMASITTLRCEILGREGHGAEPHLAADALTAAASLVLDWQVALARRVDPREPVVLSLGRIQAGIAPNVVPGRAEIEGTLRSLNPAIEESLKGILSDVARGVEIRTGTNIRLEADGVVPAVVNDPGVTAVAAKAATKVLGPGALVGVDATLGGDDFAWYLREIPGCYLFVGERQKGRAPYGWHDAGYDIDERSLPVGSAVLAAAVHEAAEGGLG